ncbi:MAG: hypothetical protein J2P41_20655, partial [Blastocatellia bacterium]|nr:hypothetical protein [Blastocatellia bacterium]
IDPPMDAQTAPGLSPRIKEILTRALAKDPKDRFQTAADFRSALFRGGQHTPPARKAVITQAVKLKPRHKIYLLGAAGVASLIMLVLFLFVWLFRASSGVRPNPPSATPPEVQSRAPLTPPSTGPTNTEIKSTEVVEPTPEPKHLGPAAKVASRRTTQSPSVEKEPPRAGTTADSKPPEQSTPADSKPPEQSTPADSKPPEQSTPADSKTQEQSTQPVKKNRLTEVRRFLFRKLRNKKD